MYGLGLWAVGRWAFGAAVDIQDLRAGLGAEGVKGQLQLLWLGTREGRWFTVGWPGSKP